MKKSVVALLVVAGAAAGGVIIANKYAEDAIKQHIEQTNQTYQELANNGEMPEISISYQAVSANVLTSSYSVSGLQVAVAELGQVASIDSITARGMQPNGLSDEGSMQLTGAKVAPAVLQMLPPETSAFVQSLALHADYNYAYTDDGQLMFDQQTRINDELSLHYRFSLAQMQEFWQFVKDVSAMSAQQQQELSQSPQYIEDVLAKLTTAALNNGAITIENRGFIERAVAMSAGQNQSPDLETIKGLALMNIAALEPLPQDMKDTLAQFVNDPKKLTLSFNFAQPLQFSQVQSGELAAQFSTPEAAIAFANLQLTANSN